MGAIGFRSDNSGFRYTFFEEMELQWYAVPAVAYMMLDCGGLEYTAVPFNGWFMGTEVGARDLCDANRYNLLQVIVVCTL